MKNDIIGKKIGFLTVKKHVKGSSYLFLCDCGNEKVNTLSYYTRSKEPSCGCMFQKRTTHGMTNTKEFRAWMGIRSRCGNPNSTQYKNYGARGVSVCDKWSKSFESFYKDMGNAPSATHSIDRIDNNGNYDPSNCRWVTNVEQQNNKRRSISYDFLDTKMTARELSEISGIKRQTIRDRMHNGWSVYMAVTVPASIHNKPRGGQFGKVKHVH